MATYHHILAPFEISIQDSPEVEKQLLDRQFHSIIQHHVRDLLQWETVRPEIDLFGLLFGYFFPPRQAASATSGE